MTSNVRTALQHEIEFTSEKYQRYMVIVPEKALHAPSKDIKWTNAEVLYKISVSPLMIPSVLRRNFGSWTQRILPLPGTGSLFPKWENKSIRFHAPRMTLLTLAEEYQDNCNQVLKILDELHEEDFEKTVTTQQVDPLLPWRMNVEELFHHVKKYFDQYRHLLNLNS